METAAGLLKDALENILVQAAEQPIQSVDFQKSKRVLNRMMATTPFDGLGFTVVVNPSDPITIADAAIQGVISNVSTRLLAAYDMPLTNELNADAKNGLKQIRRLTRNIRPTRLPCTLPIGSGNEHSYNFNNRHFNPCPEPDVLTEDGGAILLESGTHES